MACPPSRLASRADGLEVPRQRDVGTLADEPKRGADVGAAANDIAGEIANSPH